MLEMEEKKGKTDTENSQETTRPLNQTQSQQLANLEMHQSLLKQKREFEREMFRKQMLFGVDLIDD